MSDIKVPDHHAKKTEVPAVHAANVMPQHPEPGEKVRVNFAKFVQLVASHDFEGVMQKHAKEEIILSTGLLTDLANAHGEAPNENKRLTMFIAVGILIGIIITYLIVRL